MAENREIDDEELVEITGAGEFDVFEFEKDENSHQPLPTDGTGESETGKRPGGSRENGA